MDAKAVTYLILLMDTLGMKINSESVKGFWGRIIPDGDDSNHRLLDENILEPLIYLWEASKRAGEANSDLRKSNPESIGAGFIDKKHNEASFSSRRVENSVFENDVYPKPSISSNTTDSLFPEPAKIAVSQRTETPDGVRETSKTESGMLQSSVEFTGRYLYGLVKGTPAPFNAQGIDQAQVRILWYKELGAIIHSCTLVPYQSGEREQVTGWLKQHQQVLDIAFTKFNNVIPMGFDTILDGSKTHDPDEVVTNWLAENSASMLGLVQKLAGKVEYGIRISCPSEKLMEIAQEHDPAIQRMVKKMAGMKPGTAYLYRSELESLIRSSVVEVRGMMTRELVQRLKNIVCEIKEGSINKKFDEFGAEVIANLAVLAELAKADDLGAVLEDYQNSFQVAVTFTGPWPGYSFVGDTQACASV